MSLNRFLGLLALAVVAAAAWLWSGKPDMDGATAQPFAVRIIDARGPNSPWAKTSGDVDGDGRVDMIVGGHQPPRPSLLTRIGRKLGWAKPGAAAGELVWYRNPDWQRHVISTDYAIRTDIAVADIDGDGDADVVALTDDGLVAFTAPTWDIRKIDTGAFDKLHDIEIRDLDRDGDADLVLRNQSLFGYRNGDRVLLAWQEQGAFTLQTVAVPHGEGLAVADLDADGFDDIVVNDVWLKNPGGGVVQDWIKKAYSENYNWPDVFVAVADVDGDGRLDILNSPAEEAGERYRVSWFEAPKAAEEPWIEHVVADDVEAVRHFIGAGDFDGNGATDIFTAAMNQGADPDEVVVYLQCGGAQTWRKVVLSTAGSHSMQVGDFDGDSRDEVWGADWQIAGHAGDYPVTLWDWREPTTCGWRRHVIGDNGDRRNLFVQIADFDGDGLADIAAGPAWFRNPGEFDRRWSRHAVDPRLGNAVLALDVDEDGDFDLFGTAWDGRRQAPGLAERFVAKLTGRGYPGSAAGGHFFWAENAGAGAFIAHEVATAPGDYLQGAALMTTPAQRDIVLSWHRPSLGIQALSIPVEAIHDRWPVRQLSDFSQDEQVSVVDIDGDGRAEVVTGSAWLDPQPGGDWRVVKLGIAGTPDRHAVTDIDNDGVPDLIIGDEAVGVPGALWHVRDPAATAPGIAVVDRPMGPMSLGIGDLDRDGTPNVVVGEHTLDAPANARLLSYQRLANGGWQRRVLSRGDEHHNGALLHDLDGDGDLDVVSIGWTHGRVMVYENPAVP